MSGTIIRLELSLEAQQKLEAKMAELGKEEFLKQLSESVGYPVTDIEMEAICKEHGYEVTPTLLLRHNNGPTFSMLLSNDDLNKVVLCIAELGNIGEVVKDDEETESQQP